MLQLLLTVAAGLGGYLMARNFVRNRLRFVDAVHSPLGPARRRGPGASSSPGRWPCCRS